RPESHLDGDAAAPIDADDDVPWGGLLIEPSAEHDAEHPGKRPRRFRRSALFQEALRDAGVVGIEHPPTRDRHDILKHARECKAAKRDGERDRPLVVPRPADLAMAVAPPPAVPAETISRVQEMDIRLRTQWPLEPCVREVIQNIRMDNAGRDETTTKVARHYLAQSGSRANVDFRVSSKVSLAANLGVDRKKILSTLYRAASMVVHVDRGVRFAVESTLATTLHDCDLLVYIDASMNDETSLKLGLQRQNDHNIQHTHNPAEASTSLALTMPGMPAMSGREKTTAKILQSRDSWGVLFRRRDGQLAACWGRSSTWLQLLDRTTGEVLREATCQRSSITQFCEKFKSKTRLTCLDKAASNEKAERAYLKDLNEVAGGWQRLHIFCEVHLVALAHKKTFKLCDALISGQIHLALSINEGTGFTRFAMCVKKVVKARMQLSLAYLPNGDWRKRDCVEVYLPENATYDEDYVKEVISESLTRCLVGARFTVYNRSKWTRSDSAWDEFCLLEGCHGLASAAWERWCREARDLAASQFDGANAPTVPHDAAASLLHLAAVMDAPMYDSSGDANVPKPDADKHDSSKQARANAHREEHALHRRLATTFLQSDPLGCALVIRQTMEPLRNLLKQHLEHCGVPYADRQEAAAAQSCTNEGVPGEGRAYPIVESAMGQFEASFHLRVKLLMDHPALWVDLIAPERQTLSLRGFAFRLLSAADCLIQETLDLHHSTFPMKMFRLLGGAQSSDITCFPPCMYDDWSWAFLERYREDPDFVDGDVVRAELRLHAYLAGVNIAPAEATHSAVRRRLFAKGNQTHAEGHAELSAEHMLDRARRFGKEWESTCEPHHINLGGPCDPDDDGSGQSSKRGGGGAWRAFVRRESANSTGRPDLRELGRRYRELPEAELADLRVVGKHATEQWRDGANGTAVGSSFGLRAKDVQRALHRQRLEGLASRAVAIQSEAPVVDTAVLCDSAIASAVVGRSYAEEFDLKEISKSARATLRSELRALKKCDEDSFKCLTEWQRIQKIDAEKTLYETVPGLEICKESIDAVPNCRQHVYTVKHPCELSAASAAVVSNSTSTSNLNKYLEEFWTSLHKPIMHQECRPIGKAPKAPIKPPCYTVGSRKLFLHLVGESPLEESPWRAACGEQSQPVLDVWWHISAHSLDPFRGTYRFLDFCSAEERSGVEEVLLKATDSKLVDWDAFATLSRDVSWACEFYVLCEGGRIVDNFRPGDVLVKRLVTEPVPLPFWGPTKPISGMHGDTDGLGDGDADDAGHLDDKGDDHEFGDGASDEEGDHFEHDVGSDEASAEADSEDIRGAECVDQRVLAYARCLRASSKWPRIPEAFELAAAAEGGTASIARWSTRLFTRMDQHLSMMISGGIFFLYRMAVILSPWLATRATCTWSATTAETVLALTNLMGVMAVAGPQLALQIAGTQMRFSFTRTAQ
ncbi:unnamed protein product, partial [Prorocentrum cordatum]